MNWDVFMIFVNEVKFFFEFSRGLYRDDVFLVEK